jgi:hypothetical protein
LLIYLGSVVIGSDMGSVVFVFEIIGACTQPKVSPTMDYVKTEGYIILQKILNMLFHFIDL